MNKCIYETNIWEYVRNMYTCEFRTNKKTKEIYNNYVFIKINKILPHSMNSLDYFFLSWYLRKLLCFRNHRNFDRTLIKFRKTIKV